MAKSANFKVKSTKSVVKVDVNEGTYVDTAVTNTKSGGKGGGGAGWRAKNKSESPAVQGETVRASTLPSYQRGLYGSFN